MALTKVIHITKYIQNLDSQQDCTQVTQFKGHPLQTCNDSNFPPQQCFPCFPSIAASFTVQIAKLPNYKKKLLTRLIQPSQLDCLVLNSNNNQTCAEEIHDETLISLTCWPHWNDFIKAQLIIYHYAKPYMRKPQPRTKIYQRSRPLYPS